MRLTSLSIILQMIAAVTLECAATVRYDIHNLTSSNVSGIIQDRDGYIWVATDNGLNRFDGWSNVAFTLDRNDTASLRSNYVESLLNDASGNLWVGTGAGLQKYIPGAARFSNVVFPDGIHPSVRSIIQTAPERLMAVTSGYGVFSIDTKAMKASKHEDLDELIGSKYAHIIRQDGLNRIWIGGADGKITAVDKNLRLLYSDRLPSRIADIEHDSDNNIWAVTQSGLYRWDGKQSRFTPFEASAKGQPRGLMRTADGALLLFTLEDGVYRINPKDNTLRELKEYSGISPDGIIEMYQDRSGDVWCATLQKGLAMNSGIESFFRFHTIGATPSKKIECLFEDRSGGTVSASLSDGTVMTFDSNLNRTATASGGGRITSVYTGPDGTTLTGYADGRLTLSDGNHTATVGQFEAGPIKAIARDAKGRYYVGLSGDGFQVSSDMTHWKKINETTAMATPRRLGNNWINSITPHSSGKVWIGHSNGIDIYDPEKNEFIESPLSPLLRAHLVFALQEGSDGSMWIGTNYGLYHAPDHGSTPDYYGTAEGMGGNVICGIAEAHNGDIWCTTNNGISRIRHSDGKIINYNSGTGLTDREFRKGILLRGTDEKIYAAGLTGLTSFHPDAVKDQRPISAPVLTGIQLNSRKDTEPMISYDSEDTGDGVSAYVRLRHSQNTFTLDFSNFDYRNPGSTGFEYRIPKLEKEWQTVPPGDNKVTCNYMDPGKYILEVRALENGMASPATTVLIDILPPWYLTVWARLAYVVLFLIAAATVAITVRRWRQQREKEEAAEEKFKLLYNFAHELRSPVTLITSPLPALIKDEKDTRKAETFRMMQRNGYRITNLVNQMLDIRRIEKGQLKLSYRETDLKEFLGTIAEDFRIQAESRGIALAFSAPDGDVKAYVDPDNFDKVIVNLISNALKFTPEGGSIDITLRKTDGADGKPQAAIEVKDTGTGILPEDLTRIFERFYQGSRKTRGFGIGLNLTKMLVDMHHGSIRASNREDRQGACFEIRIPLGRKHLKDKEISDRQDTFTSERHLEVGESVSLPGTVPAKTGGKQHRILIADDDDEIRDYLKRELGQTYKTVTAADGNEAYRIAQENEIDLIISDINMPNSDGLSLLRHIRANADLAHIPVILLSTSEDLQTRMEGWEKGADAYLTKPFHIEELRQLCASLISGRIRLKGRFSHGEKAEEKIEKVEIKGNDELLLERIMKAVNENIGNSEFGVEELADNVGLSRVHLHRKMKALLGLAPLDFLKSVRLKRAAELLKKNNTNISQVGYTVGFSSPGQFSDSFRKYFGCSPSEYIARETGATSALNEEEPRD